jgi:hypothetical protein
VVHCRDSVGEGRRCAEEHMWTYQETGENYIVRCYMMMFTKCCSRNQIKKNGMGRECGKYGGELHIGFREGGGPEYKRSLGSVGCRRNDKIIAHFKEI